MINSEWEAELAYYRGYVHGLQDAGSADAVNISAALPEFLKTKEAGSADGYYTVGRIEGMKRGAIMLATSPCPSSSSCPTPCSKGNIS
jgi:hypothetical protein